MDIEIDCEGETHPGAYDKLHAHTVPQVLQMFHPFMGRVNQRALYVLKASEHVCTDPDYEWKTPHSYQAQDLKSKKKTETSGFPSALSYVGVRTSF